MEFAAEFVQANNLTPEQVTALSAHVKTHYDSNVIPELKKDWDTKANDNAEGILNGAAKYAAEKFGFKESRQQGEKFGDYLNRISEGSLSSAKAALADKQKELDNKLANFKGGDEYKSQIQKLEADKDSLLKKVADLEPLEGLDEKYKKATEQLTSFKKEMAYNSVKPAFPESANKYEVEAKWNAFKAEIESKYNLEIVDGKPKAIDKENIHKQVDLSELIKGNEDLQQLLNSKSAGGTGASPKDLATVEGVPFQVPKNATPSERSKAIKEYLTSKGMAVTDLGYADKFKELNEKIYKASMSK